ncbi:MAG: DUF1330 domain-containing protein [Candidatus Eremiobacteraeota bacterium]|nr:DUF1330 domain-containing protein [Candidatus Eremiobacteraeota bacterium]
MAGYLVACVQWHNADAPNEYGKIAVESLKPFGGKYLARGQPWAVLDGESAPERLAIVEFPTVAAAQEWAASSAYAPALKIRKEHATTHWIAIFEGMP